MGGLQENVRDTAIFLRSKGVEVTVVSPDGPFSHSLNEMGVATVTTDFEDLSQLTREVSALGQYDIVHVHPGPSRQLGLELASSLRLPIVMTFHGAWLNRVDVYHQSLDRILAVSPAIEERLASLVPEAASKISLMPNSVVVDDSTPPKGSPSGRFAIIAASRFDADKRNVTEFLRELWETQAGLRLDNFEWDVAGAGEGIEELEEVARHVEKELGRRLVRFHGWLPPSRLREIHEEAAVAISPGRSAIEAMGAGVPTIALASHGCVGLVDETTIDKAAYCNFGGFGLEVPASAVEVIEQLKALHENADRWQAVSTKSRKFVKERFERSFWNERLWEYYNEAVSMHARRLHHGI